MQVNVISDLLAYASTETNTFECARKSSRSKWICNVTSTRPLRGRVVACTEQGCVLAPALHLGERVLVDDDSRVATIQALDSDSVVVRYGERQVRVSEESVQREPAPPFATLEAGGEVHIPALDHLPSALLLRADGQWHLCCHGRLDERLVRLGRLDDLDPTIDRLYETDAQTYSPRASEAWANKMNYDGHVLKWGDVIENKSGVFDFHKHDRSTGRSPADVRTLDDAADRLGLADACGMISGHQDAVNVGYAHRHPEDADPDVNEWILSDDRTENLHYYDQLTILRLTENTHNPFFLDQRFVVTSSAYYSKRGPGLERVCWLSLADNRMLVHHATPKATDGAFGPKDTLDDASFWEIIDFVNHDLLYPHTVGDTPRTHPWPTRFFSMSFVNSVMHNLQSLLASVPRHSVCYQIMRVDHGMFVFVGDLHSSIRSLATIIDWCRQVGCFELNASTGLPTNRLKENCYMIFLGDLIDRGPFSIEILVIVGLLKIANPRQVVILNGNHETHTTYNRYGMRDEVLNEYHAEVAPASSSGRRSTRGGGAG